MSNPEKTPHFPGELSSDRDMQNVESAKTKVGSLKELIDVVTGRLPPENQIEEEYGSAEFLPFPFLGLVGQTEMKLALLLALANPAVGGVLLIGPRGTGKTTAIRSLLDLLPQIERSNCFYGCMPEDIEIGGIDAVCPDCARKYAEGKPLTHTEKAHLVELPLNSRLEDVIGGLDERAALNNQIRIKRGLLAQANQNILYIDEVNLLSREVIDAILDASAMGYYSVRRGPVSATYQARFTLIGSMNPEEGNLRPQIMDRFGLRVLVQGLVNPEERLVAYQAAQAYTSNPRKFVQQYADETQRMCTEIQEVRKQIWNIQLSDDVLRAGIRLIQHLKIESLRAEITLFEAARAYAAIDGRMAVKLADLRIVAPLALRLRRSEFMEKYEADQAQKENTLSKALDEIIPNEFPGGSPG